MNRFISWRGGMSRIRVDSRIAVLVALLAAPVFAGEEGITITLGTNPTVSLVHFVAALSGDALPSLAFRDLYAAAEPKDSRGQELLEELARAIDSVAHLKHYPREENRFKVRIHERSTWNSLTILASGAKDLEDFLRQCEALFPLAEMGRVRAAFEHFAPIHHRFVWRPGMDRMEGWLRRFIVLVSRVLVPNDLDRVAGFYGARWPAGMKLRLEMVPLPPDFDGSHPVSRSHSVGHVVLVEVNIDEPVEHVFGVVFHEMCHSLFEAQPVELQLELEKAFLDGGSASSSLACALFNEAVATAIGNGLATSRAVGKLDRQRSWYADPPVDAYGKAIYDRVVKQLRENRTMDPGFVKDIAAIFLASFPFAERDIRLVFRDVLIVWEGAPLRPTAPDDNIARILAISGMNEVAPIGAASALKANAAHDGTRILVVRAESLDKLEPFLPAPLVKELKTLASHHQRFAYCHHLPGCLPTLIVVAADQAEVAAVLRSVASLPRLPESGPILGAPPGR